MRSEKVGDEQPQLSVGIRELSRDAIATGKKSEVMPGRSFFGRSLMHLSLGMSVLAHALLAAGDCAAEELDATAREQAVQSLRDYQDLFRNRKVEIDVRVRKDFRPADSEGPVWYDYKVVASDGWMHTEEDVGQVLGLGGGRSDARYTIESVFDLRSSRGTKILIRDDGEISQPERTCTPTGIIRLSSTRLAQAVGWLDFWRRSRSAEPLMNAGDALELSPVVRRTTAANGRVQLVAKLDTDPRLEYELRFSDLPDVRLTSVRLTLLGRSDVAGEVLYRQDSEGFHQPHAFREIRRRIDQTPPRIDLIEESVVTRFSMRSPDEDEPMPVIEIPDGLRVIDNCPDDEGEDVVPAPSPETN